MRLNYRAATLAAIVLAGALARFQGISFGLPGAYHPDENGAAAAVSACAQGRRVERRYHYPPLMVNVACAADRVLAPLTAKDNRWHPHDVFSLRFVSATAGTATIVFVYLLALRLMTPAAALGAALLFACFPAAIATSKYGTPDSLLTMFVVLALWLQVRMAEHGGGSAYFQAALATTLAVATKYNGAFLAFSFVAAHVWAARLHGRPLLERGPFQASAAAIALGLLIGFPSVLFGGEALTLASGIAGEQKHLLGGGHYSFSLGPSEGRFVFHFQHSILPATGPLLLAITVAGLIAMALSRSTAAGVLLAFVVPYYATIEWINKVPPSYERYALPLAGVYMIAAAFVLDRLVARSDTNNAEFTTARRIAPAALLLAAACFPLWRSAAFLAPINDDTRARMGRWMQQHRDDRDLRDNLFVQWPGLRSYYPHLREAGWFKAIPPRGHPLEKTTYVLASSLFYERYLEFPQQSPEWTAFYERLFAEGEIVHEEDAGVGRYMFHNPTLRLYRIEGSALSGSSPVPPHANQRLDNTSVGQRSPDS